MILNANLKSTAVMLIVNYKKTIILFLLGNYISHNFTIRVDKHNIITMYPKRPD